IQSWHLGGKALGNRGCTTVGDVGTTSGGNTLDNNIRSYNEHLDRKTGAGVKDAADIPTAEQDVSGFAHVKMTALAERKLIKGTEVEVVPNVEVIASVVGLEIFELGRGAGLVRTGACTFAAA